MRNASKALLVSGIVVASVFAAQSSAFAEASLNSAGLLAAGSGGTNYKVTALCSGGPGASLTLNQETRVVSGTANAVSTVTGVTAVGTSISCWIKDTHTGATYGPISAGEPGSEAVVAGPITDTPTGNLIMCASANAVWSNNAPPSSFKTPGC